MHPSKPEAALLLIDWINDLEFEAGGKLLPQALAAAQATAALRKRAKQAGVPIVYCNDNFGKWRSDFRATLEHVLKDGVRGSRSRSEEHTSELQSRLHLVCRLLLEKKKKKKRENKNT